ncbi:hypothetical protein WMF11_03980 [Sorangium sp. So ce295]|uniref:hypothetical protein n=1 Tax=Sorangium sp. So ce295 TaxID=3133295 RepID=UPI003F642883
MPTDLDLLIVDPDSAAVVCSRSLGGNLTLERARQVLGREPGTRMPGLEAWSGVSPDELRQISSASYAHGADPAEIDVIAQRFPSSRYLWILVRDF